MEINYTKLKEDLVSELSLAGIAPEKHEELLGKMLEALLKRVFVETLEKLGESGAEEYEELVAKEVSEEEVARFIEEKIPNYDVFVQGIIDQFKADMKAAAL